MQKTTATLIPLALLCALVFLFSNCDKDDTVGPAARLVFSTDTLGFDTVFTTVGSTTLGFLAYNTYNKKMIINSVTLEGGTNSPFRINVDGNTAVANYVYDVEVPANDSIYIFVEVTLDPNNDTLPLIIEDAVVFELSNSNTQNLPLRAWGQDAHFFGPGTTNGYQVAITGDTTWTNDKPYVIYGGVEVAPEQKLTILAGTQIHMHNGAIFDVKGTLEVLGGTDSTEQVHFKGTRLEDWYQDIPGQWGGVYFERGSVHNKLYGTTIQNSVFGVRVDSLPETGSNPNLVLYNSTIKNTFDSGIIGVTAIIAAGNCIIKNCGRYNIQLEYGGAYIFGNCTFYNGNSLNIDHEFPILRGANYYPISETDIAVAALDLQLYNCIIYGSEDEEVQLDDYLDGSDPSYTVRFENCVLKTEIGADTSAFVNCIVNPNPSDSLFVDAYNCDLRPTALSPGIDAGISDYALQFGATSLDISKDIEAKPRLSPWDIGAYEFE